MTVNTKIEKSDVYTIRAIISRIPCRTNFRKEKKIDKFQFILKHCIYLCKITMPTQRQNLLGSASYTNYIDLRNDSSEESAVHMSTISSPMKYFDHKHDNQRTFLLHGYTIMTAITQ